MRRWNRSWTALALSAAALSVSQARAQNGACCLGNGTCVDTTQTGCATLSGEFRGVGTSCATVVCTGACCFNDLTCTQVTRDACVAASGVFKGGGTSCATHCAGKVGTSFVYQGRLDQAGAAVTTSADFEFRLYLQGVGGDQLGATVPANNVPVVNGLFTVPVDFANPQFFVGATLWLEIAVRTPAGSGAFTTLTPRQQLTATPFAQCALKVPGIDGHSLHAPDGDPYWALNVDNDGLVGIGTSYPVRRLHVHDDGIFMAKFESASPVGSVVEMSNILAGTTWEFGVIGPYEPLGIPRGSIYLHPQGQSYPGLIINPNRDVEIRSTLKLGASGELKATAGEENLRILRGSVDTLGNTIQGSGFTSSYLGNGVYRISFSTPFPAAPNVTASARMNGIYAFAAQVGGAGTHYCDISIRRCSNNELGQYPFEFIAIGPR